jgi:hypothetical protein
VIAVVAPFPFRTEPLQEFNVTRDFDVTTKRPCPTSPRHTATPLKLFMSLIEMVSISSPRKDFYEILEISHQKNKEMI